VTSATGENLPTVVLAVEIAQVAAALGDAPD